MNNHIIPVVHHSKREYDFLRWMEILEGDSPYFAGIKHNHPPTFDECVAYWKEHSEANFKARHILRVEPN